MQKTVLKWIEQEKIWFVWLGTPCSVTPSGQYLVISASYPLTSNLPTYKILTSNCLQPLTIHPIFMNVWYVVCGIGFSSAHQQATKWQFQSIIIFLGASINSRTLGPEFKNVDFTFLSTNCKPTDYKLQDKKSVIISNILTGRFILPKWALRVRWAGPQVLAATGPCRPFPYPSLVGLACDRSHTTVLSQGTGAHMTPT